MAEREQHSAATSPLPPRPWTWRTGRTLGTTLYIQVPGDDRKADVYAGIMDTAELAGHVVSVLNAAEADDDE